MRRTNLKLSKVKIKGSTFHCVTWPRVGKGRNRQFFKDKVEAQGLHDRLKTELLDFGRNGLQLTDRERVLFREVTEMLKPYGESLREAVEARVEHLKATQKSCTAAQLVSELLAAKRSDGVSEVHLKGVRCRLNAFAKRFNGQPVTTITGGEIDAWLRSLPVAPLTRNHFRQILVTAFKFAIRNG
ncbi:MAG TPA: hypothetical protein VGI25_03005, partial [Candidatus Udaeobacter sp.]